MAGGVFVGHAYAAMELDRLLADERGLTIRSEPSLPIRRFRVRVGRRCRSTWRRGSPSISPVRRRWSCRPCGAATPGTNRLATPNCLRVLMYSSVIALSVSMMPTASAHSATTARSTARTMRGSAPSRGPSCASQPTATFDKRHFGGAQAIDGRILAHGDALGVPIDQKQRNARLILGASRGTRG